jgi:hypothetical protein
MPHLPLPQLLFLSAVIVSFVAFGVTLFAVSIWATWMAPKPQSAPPRRTVAHAERPRTLVDA